MLQEFKSHIQRHRLCNPGDRVLLAISGGIDSVVMLDLFARSENEIGIAHCNFHLRGKESERDAEFVRELALKYDVILHTQEFETQKLAAGMGISVQMCARKLRYDWFDELANGENYRWIATAHNQDDVIETFFINLSRGTGIRGLSGIPLKSGKLIRPLLFASRQRIDEYALQNSVGFCEDSSNASLKYLRNRIRHQILPLFEEQNPSFRASLAETIERLAETETIFSEKISGIRSRLLQGNEERFTLSIKELLPLEARHTILFEILSDFGFNNTSVGEILRSLEGPPGKQFFSPGHRITKDRTKLILTPLRDKTERRFYLESVKGKITEPIALEWDVTEQLAGTEIPRDRDVAWLDLDMIDFPVLLRPWNKGDYFTPLGMTGFKKLSDFLIDEKVPVPDKENTWLLVSDSRIIWVVGYRIDERFKITGSTRQVLRLKYLRA